jgi:hypothetical protein
MALSQCQCINKSASKGAVKVRCSNKAKPGLLFCGIHKYCGEIFPEVQVASSPVKDQAGLCACTNQSASKKVGQPVQCSFHASGKSSYCKHHSACSQPFPLKKLVAQEPRPGPGLPESVKRPKLQIVRKPRALEVAAPVPKRVDEASPVLAKELVAQEPRPGPGLPESVKRPKLQIVRKPRALEVAAPVPKRVDGASPVLAKELVAQEPRPGPELPESVKRPKLRIVRKPRALEVAAPVPKRVDGASPTLTRALPENLLRIESRLKLAKYFLDVIKRDNIKQCLVKGQLLDSVEIIKRLGEGTFGNVFRATGCIKQNRACAMTFAVKQAKSTVTQLRHPYNKLYRDWNEVLILRDIALPLIKARITQNLPILYKTFTCPSCEFTFKGRIMTNEPCFINMMELASGDLTDLLSKGPVDDDLVLSVLFQVMAGLYALQKHGQVFNNDIKALNILFYRVTPGGYWVYNIMGRTYYVPNLGVIPVVNDFGVSSFYDPKNPSIKEIGRIKSKPGIKFGDLGKRSVIVIGKKLTYFEARLDAIRNMPNLGNTHVVMVSGKTIRTVRSFLQGLETRLTYRAILNDEQAAAMKRHSISYDPIGDEFYDPDIVPPTEFIYDTVDAVNLFIGNIQRAGQEGLHRDTQVSALLKALLRNYSDIPTRINDYYSDISRIRLCNINAGYFIDSFFPKEVDKYLAKPPGEPIDTFTV